MSGHRVFVICFLILIIAASFSAPCTQCADAWQNVSLQQAIQNNDVDQVRAAIEKNESVVNRETNNQLPLQFAAQMGSAPIVKLLLESGADLNKVASNGLSSFSQACQTGNVEIVKLMLEKKPDLNQVDQYDRLPLIMAVYSGTTDVVEMLLDEGADPNLELNGGGTPFMRACSSGQPKAVDLMLEHGAKTDVVDDNGFTPLMMACQNGSMKSAVEKLLDAGCDPDQVNNFGMTALHTAASSAWSDEGVEIVKLLAEKVSDVNLLSEHNGTPLSCSVATNRSAAVKAILDRDADLELVPEGYPAYLIQAVTNGNATMTGYLIDAGADVNQTSGESGMAALHIAVAAAGLHNTGRGPLGGGGTPVATDANPDVVDFIGVVKKLLEAGADPDAKDNDGVTPFEAAIKSGASLAADMIAAQAESLSVDPKRVVHRAARTGMATTLGIIIKMDPSVASTANSAGETPLWLAAANGHAEAAKVLLENGAEVDQPGAGGSKPLNAAIAGSHDSVAMVLLEGGAEIFVSDSSGRTPLHRASWFGCEPVVDELLKRGAHQTPTASGRTPLHSASWNGHTEVVKRLLEDADDKASLASAADTDGWTSLHKAVFRGHVETARVLLESGAVKDAADAIGMTAMDHAVEADNGELIELLK